MKRLVIILLVIGGLYFIVSKNTHNDEVTAQKDKVTTVTPTQPEHAAITQMALQSEAKAKQAAAIASVDTVAAYEQANNP